MAASWGRELGSACDAALAEIGDLWSRFPWNVPTEVLETLWSHPRLCRDLLCRALQDLGDSSYFFFYSWKIYREFCKDLGCVQAALGRKSGGDEKDD